METNNSIPAASARKRVSFAALDPYIEENIPSPEETPVRGKDYVQWGDRNIWPSYLLGLYKASPTLHAVVSGCRDYALGDGQTTADGKAVVNKAGMTVRDLCDAVIEDFFIYGGFAFEVIRAKDGTVAEVYPAPLIYLRSNKENTVFYYSEEWDKFRQKALVLPAFMPDVADRWALMSDDGRAAHARSILFVKNTRTQVYPYPLYGPAVKACETERCIADYHLNAINNGFSASMIINFNNGIPDDDIKGEIEKDVNEKFSGNANAGRVLLSWNPNKDSATTFETPDVKDFGEHYSALEKSVRQQIFTAFRANPNLFGIPTESLGFSSEEYDSAFRLFSRTVIRPVQRLVCDAFDKVYGVQNYLTITPFSLDDTRETAVQ